MNNHGLRALLDKAVPGWAVDFDNNPAAAAVELGLFSTIDAEASKRVLNFNDEAANWRRLEEYYVDYSGAD